MKIVKPAAVMAKKMLGEQEFLEGKCIRFATWCIACEVKDGVLLFNVLTKELILFDESESELLSLRDLSSLNAERMSSRALFDFLYKHWFLVNKEHNDKKLAREVREIASCMSAPEGMLGYTILTTTDCNARCFYCYEHDLERVNINKQTALDTAEYIKKAAGKKIKLHWFGGEPLFNSAVIDIITEELKKAGVNFTSTMTSNGYLVDDDMVRKASEAWNLKGIQITLDGTEEIYNKRKAYIHTNGSAFRKVIANIERLLKNGISVVVRLNLDVENADDLYALCDFLAEKFASYDKFGVYAFYIFEGKTADSLRHSFDDTYAELEKLRNYLRAKGLTRRGVVENSIKTSHCMADKDSSIVISPAGELFKCEHIGLTKNCGTIYTGVKNSEITEHWKKPPEDGAICDNCPLYPNCVRIAACPDDFAFCPDAVYKEKIERVKNAMVFTYEKIANSVDESEDRIFDEPC